MKKLADEKERALTVKFVLIDFEIENLFFLKKIGTIESAR